MWIKKSEWKTKTTYFRQFVATLAWRGKNNPSLDIRLDADENGNIPAKEHELLKECLEDPCLIDLGLKSYTRGYWTTGIIRCCVCHKEIHLFSHWANQCRNCESEYDGDGGLLAPRSLWGEETGEVF